MANVPCVPNSIRPNLIVLGKNPGNPFFPKTFFMDLEAHQCAYLIAFWNMDNDVFKILMLKPWGRFVAWIVFVKKAWD